MANATISQRKGMDTKRMVLLALFAAIAYVIVCFIRIKVFSFLSYEPKDVIILISGFLFGPLSSVIISVVVSLVEMVTISDTGIIGAVMNIISTVAFVVPAAIIYNKKRTMAGGVIGIILGTILMTILMLLWNYLITPIYMKTPRETVVAMLIPVFLPFNLVKGLLNGTLTILLYKPLVTALRKGKMLPESQSANGNGVDKSKQIGIYIGVGFVLLTCILWLLVLNGAIKFGA